MTKARVFELIEAYGAEPEGWPEDEREAGTALIAANPADFETALSEARALDAALFSVPEALPAEAVFDAIMAAAPAATKADKSFLSRLTAMFLPQGTRLPGGAVLASLLIGTLGGYAYASSDTFTEATDMHEAYSSVFSDSLTSAWQDFDLSSEGRSE